MNTTEIILAVIAILSGIITHLLDRRKFKQDVAKAKAEADENNISNMEKSLDFYEKWVDKTNGRLNELVSQVDILVAENTKLRKTVEDMETVIKKLDDYLCTDLPCKKRVKDKEIVNCVYIAKNKKKVNKKETETLKSN